MKGLVFVIFLVITHDGMTQVRNSLFDNYSVEDGLTDKTIHCIYQDDGGWIWIGTDFGVVRFDGYTFSKFNMTGPENEALRFSLVRCITEDDNGKVYIGTENQGLFIYDRKEYRLRQIKNKGLSNNSIWDIIQDRDGKLWIATENGLNLYDPLKDKFKIYHRVKDDENSLSHNFIRSLYLDSNDQLWVGTSKGLNVLDRKEQNFRHYLLGEQYKERENEVWNIFEDSKGTIWAGLYLGGLYKYDSDKDHFKEFPLDPSNSRSKTVRAVIEDKQNTLWAGTRAGLYAINEEKNEITAYHHDLMNDYSLAHNSVLELFTDKKGDLWIGTRNGISYLNFNRQAFGYITSGSDNKNELSNSEVYCLWEDKKDKIWIGTESGGVNIYDPNDNTVSTITREDGLSNNCIKAIVPDNQGNILIGTYLGGLNKLNPKTGEITVYKYDEDDPRSISDNAVWTIFSDSKNRIWIGTSQGVDLFDPVTEEFKNYKEEYELGEVVQIYEDHKNRMWFYSHDMQKLTMLGQSGEIKHEPFKARAMCEDSDQNFWLATLGNGLIQYNPETGGKKVYTMKNGLCSNVIYGILHARDSLLWLSTNNGLSRFDIASEEFRNYYHNNGLLNSQFNYGAYLKCKDGTLVFGGKKGIDFVYPEKLQVNNYVPPVVLTDFRIFNHSVPAGEELDGKVILERHISETDKIVLDHDKDMISFEFAALNYVNSNKNNYKYKLEGFDKNWNNIGNSRMATYTNLDPGEYTLRVIGSNNDNIYNTSGVSLKLVINPPFWESWWFRLIIIAVLLVLTYLLKRIITNREKLKNQLILERQTARKVHELDTLKHQFFMNISHEIRTPLSLIKSPIEKMMNDRLDPQNIQSNLELIHRNTTHLTKLINQLLDYRKLETGNVTLNLKKGNLTMFIQNQIEAFKSLAADKNIELHFKTTQDSIFIWFDPDKVEKIMNNLLSNAVKYTNTNGKIYVKLSVVFSEDVEQEGSFIPAFDPATQEYHQYIKISVKDTGIGIPQNQLSKIFNRFKQIENIGKSRERSYGTGIGLAITKDLTTIHKGHIQVKSIENRGSKFTLLLPYIDENTSEQEDDNTVQPIKQENNGQQPKPDNSEPQQELAPVIDSQNTVNHSLNKPIVLIIDDNQDIRIYIRQNFEPEYQVVEAVNGKEGWDMALEHIPDIIIADIMMPLMDGNELCRKIKKDERTSHIPLVMLTALTSTENQLEGIDAGAEDYITKPFDISLLKAKVDNILSIRKALRERYSKEMLLQPKEVVLASPDEKFIKRVITVIEKNISNNELDVDFLARNVGVSRTQLYRKISALTNMAAKEFVKDIRLKRAAQLVLQEKLTISEIALEVGFNDISYFRKCFKEKFGMNASEYLKKYRQEIL